MNALRLAAEHFKVTAMNELQYRANFVVQIINSLVALATGLVAIALVYSHTDSLQGWSQAELLAVMGIHIALGGVIRTWIQPNMDRLMRDVQEGTFDYVLTKPVDSQVMASIRQIRFWSVVDVIVGGVVLVYAATQIQRDVGMVQSGAFLLTVVMGAAMIYCVWLIITSLAFKFVRIDGVIELFDGVYQAGRWPVSIYPTWLRGTLTFVIPLAFAVTVPAEALSARSGLVVLAGAAAFLVVLSLVTRLVWRSSVRRYSGASA